MDDLVDEPLPTELEMIPGDAVEVQPPRLIQRPQPNPILDVDRRFFERQDDRRLARHVELEMLGFLGLDHGVRLVHDHDKVLQLAEVLCVGGVLRLLLVVDLGDESTLLHVRVKVQRVVPVLGLDKGF